MLSDSVVFFFKPKLRFKTYAIDLLLSHHISHITLRLCPSGDFSIYSRC